MKKIVKLGVVLLLAFGMVACGKSSSNESKSLVIYQNKAEMTEPLQAYAKKWGDENGVTVTVKTCTGSCDYGAQMKADINAGETSDIFLVEGLQGYNQYKDIIAPMDGEAWTSETNYAFKVDGKTYGFPVAVEGWGLAYNKDILDKAGIDVATLNTYSGYKAAFEKLESMKTELGLTGVVSNVTASGNTWVMGNHDFNAYLSSGLASDDRTVLDATLAGKVDETRLQNYTKWVELLFAHTDTRLLTVGTSDEQFALFGEGKYAFMHQGTWGDINVKNAGGTFNMGFAPYGTLGETAADGLFIGASSFYVLNKDSANIDLAKKFLNELVSTEAGQKVVVEEVGLISAFKNNAYSPKLPLSAFVAQWVSDGKPAYSFSNIYSLPDGFGTNGVGPIFGLFANKQITYDQFYKQMKDKIESIPTM